MSRRMPLAALSEALIAGSSAMGSISCSIGGLTVHGSRLTDPPPECRRELSTVNRELLFQQVPHRSRHVLGRIGIGAAAVLADDAVLVGDGELRAVQERLGGGLRRA